VSWLMKILGSSLGSSLGTPASRRHRERSSLCREEPAGRWRAQGNSRASGTLACPGDCCAIMRRPDLFVGRLKAEVLILLITLLIVLSFFLPQLSIQRMISENREEENDHEEART